MKLENAIKNLDKGKAKTALNNLNAFMNQVQSLVDEGVLSLESAIDSFVAYYNHQRYHEALDNLTPATVYHGEARKRLAERDKIKKQTLQLRKEQNLNGWRKNSSNRETIKPQTVS